MWIKYIMNPFSSFIKETKHLQVKDKMSFFTPDEVDTLFWCFYIFKNGLSKYEMLINRNIVVEKEEKIKYIEKIRKEKQLLKTNKIKKISEIENNLLNDECIDLKTFYVLCLLENIHFLLIDSKTYFENNVNTSNIYVIHKKKNIYTYEIEIVTDKIEKYKESLFLKTDIDKSLKAISNYTLKDLKEICSKISFTIEKEWKKEEIYKHLTNNLQ